MKAYLTRDKNRHIVFLGERRDGWIAATPVDAAGRATGPAYWLHGKTMVETYDTPAAAHRALAQRKANEDRLMRYLSGQKHTMANGYVIGPTRR